MEKKQLKLVPLGMQNFEEIIRTDRLYVDKTRQVFELTHGASKYVFLSRPRRFGKSLLASTLHAYFDGRKELFKGLAMERLEKDWEKFPVLHFDMSLGKHMDKAQLETYLGLQLADFEKLYGIDKPVEGANNRLTALIRAAYAQTGKQVVVLIDEYDAPLLDIVHEEENLPVLRNVMRNFYSPLKACDPYLRFVFLTGITKFSQLSIFSELNNIKNVSMQPEFADICGITKEELTEQLGDYVEAFAEAKGITREKMLDELAFRYDGYHFTWPSPDIFNPFSLLNSLSRRRLDSYWFGSGTPTFLIEMMRKFNVAPSEIGKNRLPEEEFDAPAERLTSITPLLYQSGYLTIKDYNNFSGLYTLDIPNIEIRIGLFESLLPNYVFSRTEQAQTTLGEMCEAIYLDRIDEALQMMHDYLLTVPQCDNTNYEGHYQQLLYVMFSLLGYLIDVEVRTATGRVDMVMRTEYALYLVELKINKSAAEAMAQIDAKNYPARFKQYTLPIIKVGIGFSTEEHTLTEWLIDDSRKQ